MLSREEAGAVTCSCFTNLAGGICCVHGSYPAKSKGYVMDTRHKFEPAFGSNQCGICDKFEDHINHRINDKATEFETLTHFKGGATRTGRKPPYHLVPLELLEAVAWTRFDGDAKYEVGNWQKGDKEFFVDCLSHAIEHLYNYPNDDSEDHLGHASCNIAFILWALNHGKVKREDFQQVARVFDQIREERLSVVK